MAVERGIFGDVGLASPFDRARRVGRAVAATEVARRQAASAALGFAFPLALGFGSGGYWPSDWGWAALALFWICAVVVLVDADVVLNARDAVVPSALVALAAWDLVSSLWSPSLTHPFLEAQRALVYVGAALAALLIVRSGTYRALLGGSAAAIVLVSAYGLATRLFPERLGSIDSLSGYRLSEPLGYFNALGIFAALGTLLALGFAARARRDGVRAVAGGAVVLLVPTLYFTFSRGAWIALALGLAVAFALDRQRLQLTVTAIAVAPWAALALWLASRNEALTHRGTQLAAASHAGHRYALALVGLVAGASACSWAVHVLGRRIEVGRTMVASFEAALALAAVAALVAGFARFGSPVTIARHAYGSFLVRDEPRAHGDLNRRLFTLANTRRLAYWRVAWRDYTHHPLLGSGSGSYEQHWIQMRPFDYQVRDAHSLYLETLAETGPVGLGLLLTALLAPLAVALRARRRGLSAFACGAYVAFLLHAGLDWDWEMPAVTVTALFCGIALVVGARRVEAAPLAKTVRVALIAASIALAVVAFVGLEGNRAVAASEDAARRGDAAGSAAAAHRAIRWAPWSAEAWQFLGEAQLKEGRTSAARHSFVTAVAKDDADWTIWADLALASRGEEQAHAVAQVAALNPLEADVRAFVGSAFHGKRGVLP